jgi:hypothetical protein
MFEQISWKFIHHLFKITTFDDLLEDGGSEDDDEDDFGREIGESITPK